MPLRPFAAPTSAASILALALLGCVETPDLGSSAGKKSWEEFRAGVYQEPVSGVFIVDWDRPIHGEAALFDFWSSLQPGALSIYNNGTDIKWSTTQKKQLTYCISDAFGARKAAVVAAMAKATEMGWERMGDVDFRYLAAQDATCTATNANVLFDINPVNSNGQYLARAFFPDDPRSVRNVLIDAGSFDPQQTGNIPLENILGHELGHVLGFRHEHIRPEANAAECAEDNQFRGLTPYDSASVMHYPQCNGTSSTLAFTERDRQGVVAVYGAPVVNMPPTAQVTAPANGATVPPTFTVQAQVVDTDVAEAELAIDGITYDVLTAAPFTFQVTGLATGPHTLAITATDAAGQTVTTTINVTVRNDGDGDPDPTDPDPTDPDVDGDGVSDTITGGCSAGGADTSTTTAPLAALLVIGLLATRTTRRRRRDHRDARALD